jgi:tetratricopeptide (TPR) repeat protein
MWPVRLLLTFSQYYISFSISRIAGGFVKTILAAFLILFILIPVSTFGKIPTITDTVKQPFGGSQAPEIELFEKADALWDGEKYTDPDKAIEYLNNAIKLQPYAANAYEYRGLAYKRLYQYQRAIEDFNESIRLKPDSYMAYNNRGSVYSDLGLYHTALRDYDQAIRLKPDYAYAYSNRGNVYSDLGQDQRAIEDYNWAICLKPDIAEPYYNRGLAYYKFGQYQRAIEDFNESIRLRPSYVMAYTARGVAYAHLGQYKKAQDDYDEAIRLKPDYHLAFYYYACSFSLQKDATQACNWLGWAIERGYRNWKYIETDRNFDNIRNKKCFTDILDKYAR